MERPKREYAVEREGNEKADKIRTVINYTIETYDIFDIYI